METNSCGSLGRKIKHIFAKLSENRYECGQEMKMMKTFQGQ